MSEISPKPGSLSVIIGSYKSAISKIVRKQLNPITFAWQSRFYDHIIRNENELNRIREYIMTNPAMWERDRNNVENIWM
jgi:REP element-mobilizing transposase RayT